MIYVQISVLEDEDEVQPDVSPKKHKARSKPSPAAHTFRLRVALRSAPSTQLSTDEEEAEEEEQRIKKIEVKRAGESSHAKRMRCVTFEDERTEVARLSSPEKHGCDSEEDVADSFLAKRQQNIKANKAMVNQKNTTISDSCYICCRLTTETYLIVFIWCFACLLVLL